MGYNLSVGIWKSIKNWLVTVAPAIVAGWTAFVNNLPQDQQVYAMALAGFVGYLVKNWFENKD